MVFLKLVHTEYQVNHKTQPFWVKVVHLVRNVQTLAGHAIGAICLVPTSFVIYLVLRMHQFQKYHLLWDMNQPNILLSLAFMKDCHLYWELQVMAIKAVGPAEGLPEAVKVLQRPLNLRL